MVAQEVWASTWLEPHGHETSNVVVVVLFGLCCVWSIWDSVYNFFLRMRVNCSLSGYWLTMLLFMLPRMMEGVVVYAFMLGLGGYCPARMVCICACVYWVWVANAQPVWCVYVRVCKYRNDFSNRIWSL
ncbi:hypothetical protein VPH35_077556 [Triticum aestivum]|uniref:Transmembrane protein n=1 Tax=Aegilops tauschii subsp. strangulata TaxID=200361 RepID=A0A453HTS4_AEGTS